MKRPSARRTVALGAVALAVVACVVFVAWRDASRWSWGDSWYEKAADMPAAFVGRTCAYVHLAQGELRLVEFGSPPLPDRVNDTLQRQFGIAVRETDTGCIVTTRQRVEWHTYNSVMLREIDRRFGLDAVLAVTTAADNPRPPGPVTRPLRNAI
jgi:hypothetical protein